MSINLQNFHSILNTTKQANATLVAVSKIKPVSDIQALYDAGQRDFGENYVQELLEKQPQLPADIRWHFIGHLQSNKVKYIAPFVHLIHGVDSFKLLQTIAKEGAKLNRKINCLLQVFVAQEETKFGLSPLETIELVKQWQASGTNNYVQICGIMGMASFTDDQDQLRAEFRELSQLFNTLKNDFFSAETDFNILSMGMSGDYQLAIEEGSNMVRVGSLLFGKRI